VEYLAPIDPLVQLEGLGLQRWVLDR
jgi:hypothetical protein